MTVNKYKHGTPAWQLFENMKSHEACAAVAATDAERALDKGKSAREAAQRYRVALAVLDAHGDET